mmetsp:Transcript_42597/g.102693  ORF Transcript_42597/g.102693 Transcript_42597/m.102693 type:complete len:101 (-) Transcript_42597:1303-1605(-)
MTCTHTSHLNGPDRKSWLLCQAGEEDCSVEEDHSSACWSGCVSSCSFFLSSICLCVNLWNRFPSCSNPFYGRYYHKIHYYTSNLDPRLRHSKKKEEKTKQ